MNEEHFSICIHLTVTYPSWCRVRTMPELRNCSNGFVDVRDSLGSCPECPTNYSISIARGKAHFGGWLIEIAAYYQLGRCRSPFDWDWKTMCEYSRDEMVRGVESKPGIVRHRWSQQTRWSFLQGGGLLTGRLPTNEYTWFLYRYPSKKTHVLVQEGN